MAIYNMLNYCQLEEPVNRFDRLQRRAITIENFATCYLFVENP